MRLSTLHIALLPLLVLSILIFSCSSGKRATYSDSLITTAIDSNQWRFIAQQVRPQIGNNLPANGFYTVDYRPGKLAVYLPYFGRAFGNISPYDNKGPLDFTLTEFSAEKTALKPGKWRVIFRPKNETAVQTLTFTIFGNGSATLNVIFTNRSPISFSGSLAPYTANMRGT